MKYTVCYAEKYTRTFTIEADSVVDVRKMVYTALDNGCLALNNNDFDEDESDIEWIREADDRDIERYDDFNSYLLDSNDMVDNEFKEWWKEL